MQVRTILKTLDDSSDPAIVQDIRRECANLSASSTAVLMEVRGYTCYPSVEGKSSLSISCSHRIDRMTERR